MKRSRSLVLTSMMAGGSLTLHACDNAPPATQWADPPSATAPAGDQVQARAYATLEECKASGAVPAAQCDQAYSAALADNQANAPRFGEQRSCEEQYGVGQCVPRNNGSFFTPLLTGFIIGQALNGGFGGRAYYRGRDGHNYLGGGGGRLGRDYVTGRTRVGSDAFGPPATRQAPARVQSRSGVVSRGGFGGGGRGYG
ncbi:MAG: DUF1190 domain-containing protein [Proteobacteria bacterium]|nr:DUF1190 domain-containing protein [Pseudomonadota bacterium]